MKKLKYVWLIVKKWFVYSTIYCNNLSEAIFTFLNNLKLHVIHISTQIKTNKIKFSKQTI